jgi:DNA-directed RNA polymerase III subunit RPC4
MTASGPFAMGPSAMSGPSSSRSALKVGTAISAPGPSASKIGADLTNAAAPRLHSAKSKVKGKEEEEDKEMYSDPEEDGVEIIDMTLVKDMDWSAPDILKRATKSGSKVKKEVKDNKMKDGMSSES